MAFLWFAAYLRGWMAVFGATHSMRIVGYGIGALSVSTSILFARGTLPRLTNDELSRKVIEMGRVFVNQSSDHSFTISNAGIMDTEHCYELQVKNNNVYQMFLVLTTDEESASDKLIDVRSKEFVLTAISSQTVAVHVHLMEAGDYSLLITLNIDADPFESTAFVCKGVADRQEITIESHDLIFITDLH